MEILVVIGILAILATVVYLSLGGARTRSGDDLRRAELDRMGQFLKAAGSGIANFTQNLPEEGDLNVLFDEIEGETGNQLFGQRPQDPNAPDGETGFDYIINDNDIVIYANLAESETEINLPYNQPTPGGGDGIFEGTGDWSSGLNNTNKYYQVTN